MSYKTLILIDNSDSLTTLNREIINQTVKYILLNADKDNSFSIATTGRKLSYLSDFEDSLDTKVRSLEYIQYENDIQAVEDAVMEVISDWKSNDFAGRDIILISDGHERENSYTTEELYFELNDGSYPVYAIGCVQDNNTDELKKLSSIARISKGGIFYTEFENSDSAVEEKIGQAVFEKMREYRMIHYSDSTEQNEYQYTDEVNDVMTDLSDKIYVENEYLYDEGENYKSQESVIYEMPNDDAYDRKSGLFYLSLFIVTITAFSAFIIYLNKKRRKEKSEEEKLISSLKSSMTENKSDSLTRTLYQDNAEDDGGTRVLYQAQEGVDITLEDRADPTKYFRACIRDRIVIGRSKSLCDVSLSYDDSVSQRHCEMFLRGNEVYVRDLSSSNGTSVNQQKVYQEVKLNSGDILKVGQLSLYVQILRRESFAGI